MLFDSWKPEPPKRSTKVRTPVRLSILEINRNGMITIMFNQPMKRPPFLDNEGEEKEPLINSKRELVPLSSLDVQRDILDVEF